MGPHLLTWWDGSLPHPPLSLWIRISISAPLSYSFSVSLSCSLPMFSVSRLSPFFFSLFVLHLFLFSHCLSLLLSLSDSLSACLCLCKILSVSHHLAVPLGFSFPSLCFSIFSDFLSLWATVLSLSFSCDCPRCPRPLSSEFFWGSAAWLHP